jgi:MFS family permease
VPANTGRTAPSHASLWAGTDYGWWLGADTANALSTGIADFAIPLITLSVTGSATLGALSETILIGIQSVLTIPGGVIQDRYDRKTLMLLWGISGVILFACATAADIAGALNWAMLVLLVVLLGIRAGLLGGTSNAMLRGIVADEQLPRAMSLNSARDSTVTLIGGPISGFLMALGRAMPLAAGALMNFFGTLVTLGIHRYWRRDSAGENAPACAATSSASSENTDPRPTLRDALGGLWWLLKNRFQRRLMIISAVTTAAGNSFLLITTMQISAGGSNTISAGFINSAAAIGMLLGALVASRLISAVPNGLIIVTMFVTMGAGFVGAALVPTLWLKALFVLLSLTVLPAGSAAIGGFSNVLVSKDKLGRVGAGTTLLQYGAYAALAAVSGWAMQQWGYTLVCLALAGLIALSALAAITMRSLVTMPVPSQWAAHIERWNLERF